MADQEDLEKELERLRAENEALKARQRGSAGVGFRVSEKGAVSVYGLGRFPVTLYQEQWEKLFSHLDELKDFIAANRSRLKKKQP
jgi:hypothetical protein